MSKESALHLCHPILLLHTMLETLECRCCFPWFFDCGFASFLSGLSLPVSATIQVNTQDSTDFIRHNPALSCEHKSQGKLHISTPAGADLSVGENSVCLLFYCKSCLVKRPFLSFLLGFGWTIHRAKCWALTRTASQEGVTKGGSISHQQWKSNYRYKVWEKYLLEVQP